MIAIIDYDAGNIRSVEKAFEFLGEKVRITSDPKEIMSSDAAILPGVGAFGLAMERLRERNLAEVIQEYVLSEKKPFLGICLGLQLLFEKSEESPLARGLSILKGSIRKLPTDGGRKVPEIGWNSLSLPKESRLMKGLPEGSYVYFVHSYYLTAEDEGIVAASTDYGVTVHAAVESGNLFACQFHPEKSGAVGLSILRNFIEVVKERC